MAVYTEADVIPEDPLAASVDQTYTEADVVESDGPPKESPYFDMSFFDKRMNEYDQIMARDQDPASTALQVAGKTGVGTAMDALGATTLEPLGKLIYRNAPGAKEALAYMMKDPVAQAIGEQISNASDWWTNLQEESPTLAANLEAIGNILGVVPVGKAAEKGTKYFGKIADTLDDLAMGKKAETAQDLVRAEPDLAKDRLTQLEHLDRMSEKNIFADAVVDMSDSEKTAARLITEVITPEDSVLKQRNAAYGVLEDIWKKTSTDLAQYTGKVNIAPADVIRNMDLYFTQLMADSPGVAVDLTNRLAKASSAFMRLSIKNKLKETGRTSLSPHDVWELRKEYDNWINTRAKKGIDPNSMAAPDEFFRSQRNALNSTIEQYAPGSDYRQFMDEYSSLRRTLEDNVDPKALKFVQQGKFATFLNKFGLRQPNTVLSTQGALTLGTGATTGAVGYFLGLTGVEAFLAGAGIVGTGGALHLLRTQVLGPKGKQMIANVLRHVDAQVAKSGPASAMAQQWSVERAAILGSLKELEESEVDDNSNK